MALALGQGQGCPHLTRDESATCNKQRVGECLVGRHASGRAVWREKKSLVETRDTLAAARRDTSAVYSGGVVSELRALQQPGLGY
eukprot:scaffold714_cov121-Isochrysis_galbana.AAC.4